VEKLRQAKRTICPVQFYQADLMMATADDLHEASHVYIFAAGMPPELQLQLCRLVVVGLVVATASRRPGCNVAVPARLA
jgi:hypothetical protein